MRNILSMTLYAALAASPAVADGPAFGLPIACTLGEDCFVQKYVDIDPGAPVVDYACGSLSSEEHQGTDFRVLPGASADVLAAAPGRVEAVRDGMADNRLSDPIDVPSERACGNAVLIDHGDGVESIVCHMSPGTLAVATGDTVEAGQRLGRVGASGQAAFPHVHFQVMVGGVPVDPFTGAAQGETACGEAGEPLWNEAAQHALSDTPRTAALAAGFAAGPVTMGAIQDGELPAKLTRSDTAIVAYGFAFGPESGDRHVLTMRGPGISVDHDDPQERPQAQAVRFAGKRMPDGLAPGEYTMRYQIVRDGQPVDTLERTMTVE